MKPVFDLAIYRQRLTRLMASQPDNSLFIIGSGHLVTRSNDTEYPLCVNKSFYYFTGFNEPDAALVVVKRQQELSVTLFCQAKDPLAEVWHGRRVGPEQAMQQFAIDHSFAIGELAEKLSDWLLGLDAILYLSDQSETLKQTWQSALEQVKSQRRRSQCIPKQFIDVGDEVNELRLHKSADELAIMRQANVITRAAHIAAMQACQPGKYEYQLEAEIHYQCQLAGARTVAYNSIVGGGENATILHYTDNCDRLIDNTLVLIDAGAEYQGYAADITRTFPVNGRFSTEQRQLYQLVLNAQRAAIAAVKPGATLALLNKIAQDVLTEGLHALGILGGNLTELKNGAACKAYFIHGIGHWLGLDVHDVGDYQIDKEGKQQRPFSPGMVLTIEPGLYFPADAEVDAKWRGIGIRIEDNIVVTEHGYENLSVGVPTEIDEIEKVMAANAGQQANNTL